MKIEKIYIGTFRSIIGMTLKISPQGLTTICGVNNVGKTNILRAVDLFFAADVDKFNSKDDVPHHIERGSRGGSHKAEIKVTFSDEENGRLLEISAKFIPRTTTDQGELILTGFARPLDSSTSRKTLISESECLSIIRQFNVYFIEANKTDINSVVQDIFTQELLPDIDRKRSKQTQSLKELNTFIQTSQEILKQMEKDVTDNIKQFIINVEGVSSQNWEAKVAFPEFIRLRQAISRLVSLTVSDANDKDLEFKGSGVQKIILLAVMRYLSQRQANNTVWLLDAPEAFLQPSLQREVFRQLKALGAEFPVIITTHSPYFVDVNDLDDTHLIVARYEKKTFNRKITRKYVATFSEISPLKGYEKMEAIRLHLGIESSDGWVVAPFNIIVEGEEDKNYLRALYNRINEDSPNVLVAGSATKIKAYLQFLHQFTKENSISPKVLCLFDHDHAGKENYRDVKPSRYANMTVLKDYVVREDKCDNESFEYEFEDVFPSNLLIEAVNSFLKNIEYRKISSTALRYRYSSSNIDKPVLDVLANEVHQRNQDKVRISFFDDGVKKYISQYICKRIPKMADDEFQTIYALDSGLYELLERIKNHSS